MDENKIRAGEYLEKSIRRAITIETDFVVIFIGPEAVRSDWVKRELKWALAREREISRIFVIPVLLEKESWNQLPIEFQNRRYLQCTDFTESGIKYFAKQLCDELFALVSGNLRFVDSLSPTLLHEDEARRRERVKRLAAQIGDNQNIVDEDMRLSKDRLSLIVTLLDIKAKLQLLALYEIDRGRFRDQTKTHDLTKIRFLKIDFILHRFGKWSHILNWEDEAFVTLQKDYGLGDKSHLVREVFLDGIAELTDIEKDEIFSEIEIIKCDLIR
jgi:hypothetical protein